MINTRDLPKGKLNIALVGARIDGQAGVILDALSYYDNVKVVAFFDNTPNKINEEINGIPVVGNIDEITGFDDIKIDAVHVAIGDNKARYDIYKELESMGFQLLSIIHPSAVISPSAKIGEGCFVGANAVIQNNVIINDYVLINTAALIEHDNVIGKAVHIAPGACTAGRVEIHDLAFLGIGALVVPDVTIGRSAFINAGVLVKRNVADGLTMVGYTAKVHSKNVYLDLD